MTELGEFVCELAHRVLGCSSQISSMGTGGNPKEPPPLGLVAIGSHHVTLSTHIRIQQIPSLCHSVGYEFEEPIKTFFKVFSEVNFARRDQFYSFAEPLEVA